jgi:hypothetical protein
MSAPLEPSVPPAEAPWYQPVGDEIALFEAA